MREQIFGSYVDLMQSCKEPISGYNSYTNSIIKLSLHPELYFKANCEIARPLVVMNDKTLLQVSKPRPQQKNCILQQFSSIKYAIGKDDLVPLLTMSRLTTTISIQQPLPLHSLQQCAGGNAVLGSMGRPLPCSPKTTIPTRQV